MPRCKAPDALWNEAYTEYAAVIHPVESASPAREASIQQGRG